MGKKEIVGYVKAALTDLNEACMRDEGINHDPYIGKAINRLLRLRDRLEGRAL